MYLPLGASALPTCAAIIHATAIALGLITPHQSGLVDEPAGWVLLSAGVVLVFVSRRFARR